MDLFTIFKGTHRWGQMIQRLLMISLWGSVIIFITIAIMILMEGFNGENIRNASMIGGVAMILAMFTFFLQKSLDVSQQPKTLHAYYELALLMEETQGLVASKDVYQEMINKYDEHLGPAYLSMAAIELEQTYPEKAITYIEQAAKENWVWYLPGLEMLADHYQQQHQAEKYEEIIQAIKRVKELEERASQEIYYFSEHDRFQSVDQSMQIFSPVVRILQSYLRLDELFIVKKRIESIPDRQVYAFAIVVDRKEEIHALEEKIYQDCYDKLAQPLGKYIFFDYTLSFIFLSKEDKNDRRLFNKLVSIPNAKLDISMFEKQQKPPISSR